MGNMICSINSETDFPPLNQPTRLYNYKEDRITEEDTSFNSEEDSDSSNETIFVNISFQEALTRERAHNRRKNDILNLVTLRKEELDSRYQTPSKKVSDEDSGWWKITGKNVVPENKKSEKNPKIYVLKKKT